ncbi:MAG: hypothetical protein UT63_C0030G0004 [Candidatus Gottesmanbacteria bacterium GW2011_GWC2_39_8]|uniref:Uncharacterized protein n=1 Tax=Candidatus Gottesmanbacteria bacterium GW2011_GWC2_39_8 TaxID=1618450 RepID=A0A0G0Q670_9BACT|nr:MAG: hypothetical protein UT63_C0030G0004 [Candidatus Gottesmanbacteria bacterium GW2011_GWC2_39_8]
MKIVKDKITIAELAKMAEEKFGDLVKAVVDVDKEIMALDGDLHADEERLLLEKGSKQKNLWGINLYPLLPQKDWIEFDSMINLRPADGNKSRGVDNISIQQKIISIVNKLVEGNHVT